LAELQKDPITRGDFLGFGAMGAVMAGILGISSGAYVLGPVIKTEVLGQSDVATGWQKVGSVTEVTEEEPKVFQIEFPIEQVYGDRDIQKKFPEAERSDRQFTIRNAVWLSWRTRLDDNGHPVEVLRPSFLEEKSSGFTRSEREEIKKNLNVLNNSCAHLGCPVRWVTTEGEGEFLCPCHGGIYNINGDYVAGPPPRGMYRYAEVKIEEDGSLYVKHKFDIEDRPDATQPYVV
jgi:Rieske Fe-S protein